MPNEIDSRLQDVDTLNEKHIEQLWMFFTGQWWCSHRSLTDTRRIVAGSTHNFGIIDKAGGDLVGYSRVISDGISKALVLDVIVADTHRGRGLGEHLMNRMISHPALSDVRHFELYCLPDKMRFYERWGFTTEVGESRFMRRQV